jgi:hypothetical protein
VAAFLDVGIYKKLDVAERRVAKRIIFAKLNNGCPTTEVTTYSATVQASTAETNTMTPLDKLAALCGRRLSAANPAMRQITLDEEISMYINAVQSADNFQQFWRQHGEQLPRLANLVRRMNMIPATSVSSEALFSVAAFIQRKQRLSLSSRTLRYLLVLKNRRVVEKLVSK